MAASKSSEEQFIDLCTKLANDYIELYERHCHLVPQMVALTALSGALAALATAGGFKRNNVIDALNSSFDDIEESKL